MAHQIEPDDGEFLEPDEVVARLRDSLEFFQASKQEGEKAIRAQMESRLEWGRRKGDTDLPSVSDLEAVVNETYLIAVGDREDDLKIMAIVKPDTPIFVGYESASAQRDASELAERIAEILGYDCQIV